MKKIFPSYYSDFACIADQCRHSCCIGWEIDIDPESLTRFQSISGELGKRLRKNICIEAEEAHFRLDAQERCPFLNGKGLCELILQLGEDSLCQICADHPRFRNFFSDREEIGLGLCCEAAARLILGQEKPAVLFERSDGCQSPPCNADEAFLLQLRSDVISIMQDRRFPFAERIDSMLRHLDLPMLRFDLNAWAAFLQTLEQLDPGWSTLLRSLCKHPDAPLPCLPQLETAFEQLIVYLLYRHLPAALEDEDIVGRIAFAVLIVQLVNALCVFSMENGEAVTVESMAEIARMVSSEIEYSDENLYAILDELHRVFPDLDSM